jgi:hypothetical protein
MKQPRLRQQQVAGPFIPAKHLKYYEMGRCKSWSAALDVMKRFDAADAAAGTVAGATAAARAPAGRKRKASAALQYPSATSWQAGGRCMDIVAPPAVSTEGAD